MAEYTNEELKALSWEDLVDLGEKESLEIPEGRGRKQKLISLLTSLGDAPEEEETEETEEGSDDGEPEGDSEGDDEEPTEDPSLDETGQVSANAQKAGDSSIPQVDPENQGIPQEAIPTPEQVAERESSNPDVNTDSDEDDGDEQDDESEADNLEATENGLTSDPQNLLKQTPDGAWTQVNVAYTDR